MIQFMKNHFVILFFLFSITHSFSLFSMENINSNENSFIIINNTFSDFQYPSDNLFIPNDEEYLNSIEKLKGTFEKRATSYKTIINDLIIKFSSLTALKQQNTIQKTLQLALMSIENINFNDITLLDHNMNELTQNIHEIIGYNTIKFEIDLNNIYKTNLDLDYFNLQKEFLENMNSEKLAYFSNKIYKGINNDAIFSSVSTYQNYILHSKTFGSHYSCLEIIDTINNNYEFAQIHTPKLMPNRGYQIICYFLRVLECDTRYIIWFEGYNPSIEINKFVNIYNRTDEEIFRGCQESYFNLIKNEIKRTTYVPPRIANKAKITPVKERSTQPRKQIRRTSLSAPTNSNPNAPINDKNTSKINNLPPLGLDTLENVQSPPSARTPAPLSAPDRMLRRNRTADHK